MTDWSALIRDAVAALNLPPDAIWSLSPRELESLLSADTTGRRRPALDRAGLSALLDRWPDAPAPTAAAAPTASEHAQRGPHA